MGKVTVTREQMKAVEWAKTTLSNLESIIRQSERDLFDNTLKSLNGLGAEKIVLAWHGYVEVEPKYVSFEEAMKALGLGKKVHWHVPDGIVERFELELSDELEDYGSFTLRDLFNGKFTIEGDGR